MDGEVVGGAVYPDILRWTGVFEMELCIACLVWYLHENRTPPTLPFRSVPYFCCDLIFVHPQPLLSPPLSILSSAWVLRKPIPLPTPIHIARLVLALLPRPPRLIHRLVSRRRWIHTRLRTRIAFVTTIPTSTAVSWTPSYA